MIRMPEVFRTEGYVFFFYANEGNEPMHVHVRRAGGFAKFWMEPVLLDHSEGMKTQELARAEQLIIEHWDEIRRRWNEVQQPHRGT
jgi:hypothetical protein